MALIDRVFAIEGLRRAWPCDGAIAVEVVDRCGRLRAGRFADSGLVLSPYACDPALGAIPVGDGTLVVHRHRRRAVVVGADWVAKHVRKGGARIARNTLVAGRVYRSWGLEVALVKSWAPTSVSFTRLAGRSLADLGDAALPGWRFLADAWRAAEDHVLAPYSGAHEARNLARWEEHARASPRPSWRPPAASSNPLGRSWSSPTPTSTTANCCGTGAPWGSSTSTAPAWQRQP